MNDPHRDQSRQRLARALSDFWYSGSGPTHEEIYRVFDGLDIAEDVAPGSKRERVYSAVMITPDAKFSLLVSGLVELLAENGDLLEEPGTPSAGVERLKQRLRP